MSVALVAGFMTLLDVSIVNVALPSIRNDLDLSPGELQWVLSGYALTFGLLLVPAAGVAEPPAAGGPSSSLGWPCSPWPARPPGWPAARSG